MAPRDDEILLEFHRIGNYVRVCAVDPVTFTEISIQGPVTASQADLGRMAIRRLQYVLKKKAQSGAGTGEEQSQKGFYV